VLMAYDSRAYDLWIESMSIDDIYDKVI
jgi:hypothetical protein